MASCLTATQRFTNRVLTLLALLCLMQPAIAIEVLDITAAPLHPLGKHLQLLRESGAPLGIDEARRLAIAGNFSPGRTDVPSFGIGAPAVWLHLPLENRLPEPQPRHLVIGVSWIDRLDMWLVQDGRVIRHVTGGDGSTRFLRPVSGLGHVFEHDFAPGRTDVFMRAATPDPLMLPVQILTPEQASGQAQVQHYLYGLVYGFLLALAAYNATLWLGLRQPGHRDYAIYLTLFILLNLAYTGHGYLWLWPGQPEFQRYIILVLMILFCISGLRFAITFLDLERQSPRLTRHLHSIFLVLPVLMLLAIALERQREAALLAFSTTLAFTLTMVALGWHAARQRWAAGRYFLAAACSGMAGGIITVLTIWGWLPYALITFHAAEIGILTEASLLALAVAHLVHQHDIARREAEEKARTDLLTGLLNRSTFTERAEGIWNVSRRSQRPLAVILLGLDQIKMLNDTLGHGAGDNALQAAAQQIRNTCRSSDVAARWSGEAFIILLPDTGLEKAQATAERLRDVFRQQPLGNPTRPVWLHASFGVAARDQHFSLEDMINEADTWMHRARSSGEDQVCSHSTVFSDSTGA